MERPVLVAFLLLCLFSFSQSKTTRPSTTTPSPTTTPTTRAPSTPSTTSTVVNATNNGVSGDWSWRKTLNYRVQRNGNNLQVSVLSGGAGPYTGTVTGPNTIHVNFGPKCCNGTIRKQGKQIDWSNKTSWNRRGAPVVSTSTPRPTTTTTVTTRPTSTRPHPLVDLTKGLKEARKKLVDLAAQVKDVVTNHAAAFATPGGAKSREINNVHTQAQSSLTRAHGAILEVENALNKLIPQPKPTSAAPSTTRPKPTFPKKIPHDPSDPADSLKSFFHETLVGAQTEAQSDLQEIESLIKRVLGNRRDALNKLREEDEKREASERANITQIKQKRREDAIKRRSVRDKQREERDIAFEHFHKRNPPADEVEKVRQLMANERRLRNEQRKEERQKRRQEEKAKRKTRRQARKALVAERSTKRDQIWKSSMQNLTEGITEISKKTVVTLGHAIQRMQNSLSSSRDELQKVEKSCTRSKNLVERYKQASSLTEQMKNLAVRTIDQLKKVRGVVVAEEGQHQEKEDKRRQREESELVSRRVEARNKRRQRRRREEQSRKKRRSERREKRIERRTKFDQRQQALVTEQEKDQKKVVTDQEKSKKFVDQQKERDSKRRGNSTETPVKISSQIRDAIQNVVDATKKNLEENLKDLKINVDDENCEEAVKNIQQIGAKLIQKLTNKFK